MNKLIIRKNYEEKIYINVHCDIFFSSNKNVLEIKFFTEENIIKYVMHSDIEIKSIFTLLRLVSEHISKDVVVLRDYPERSYVFMKGEGCEYENRFTAHKEEYME